MRILITGHKGFVGRYFVEKYQGHDIIGIDIKEGLDCRDFFKQKDGPKIDLLIHLAAIVGGRQTIENDPLSVATDLAIDSDMVQWALREKPGRVVYFSSSAAYPTKLQTEEYYLKESDIDLTDVSNPDMTYGWAKLTGEYILQYLAAEGIRTHIFRPFSGYGTDQDLSYPFPAFISRAKKREEIFEIWGDGEQVRDFIHIRDICDATISAIEQDVTGPINLGSGIATSFNDLYDMIKNLMPDYKSVPHHILSAPVGVQFRCSNNMKMNSFYRTKISLEEGIDMALRDVT